ncbi:MAG TPA: sigma-70 family RNA polymerase sigma factor [Firmicutes bacterium]|nr:sigma-70 family RNA polymerase sigma factor [Bacillota bacterium]
MKTVHGDEKELLTRCRQGDLAAYDILMERYEKKIYALCLRMTGNSFDAEDMAQEVFLKAFRALPTFHGRSAFSTWLFRIAANTCLDERRRRKRRPVVLPLDKMLPTEDGEMRVEVPDSSPDPLAEAINREMKDEIQELLDMLPPRQRSVIILRDLQGFSYEEIARMLKINMGTLKSRLNRARSRLVTLYRQQEEQKCRAEHLKGEGGLKHEV